MSERALVYMRRGISLYKAFPRVSDFRLFTEAVSVRRTWYRSCNIRLLFTRGVSAIRRSSSVVLFRCSIPPPSTFSHVTYLRVCFCTSILVTCQKYLFFFLFCSSFLRRTNHSAWFPFPRALALKLFFLLVNPIHGYRLRNDPSVGLWEKF